MAIAVVTPKSPGMLGNFRRELRRKTSIEDHIKRIRSASLQRYGPDIFSRRASMSDLKDKNEENLKTSKSDEPLIPKISKKGNRETAKKAKRISQKNTRENVKSSKRLKAKKYQKQSGAKSNTKGNAERPEKSVEDIEKVAEEVVLEIVGKVAADSNKSGSSVYAESSTEVSDVDDLPEVSEKSPRKEQKKTKKNGISFENVVKRNKAFSLRRKSSMGKVQKEIEEAEKKTKKNPTEKKESDGKLFQDSVKTNRTYNLRRDSIIRSRGMADEKQKAAGKKHSKVKHSNTSINLSGSKMNITVKDSEDYHVLTSVENALKALSSSNGLIILKWFHGPSQDIRQNTSDSSIGTSSKTRLKASAPDKAVKSGSSVYAESSTEVSDVDDLPEVAEKSPRKEQKKTKKNEISFENVVKRNKAFSLRRKSSMEKLQKEIEEAEKKTKKNPTEKKKSPRSVSKPEEVANEDAARDETNDDVQKVDTPVVHKIAEMSVSELGKLQIKLNLKAFMPEDSAVIVWLDDIPESVLSVDYHRPSSILLPKSTLSRDEDFQQPQSASAKEDVARKKPNTYSPRVTRVRNALADPKEKMKNLTEDGKAVIYRRCSACHVD